MTHFPLATRRFDIMLAALLGGTLVASLALTVSGNVVAFDGESLGSTCVTHMLFDLDCPFCGLTRSFIALAHGDLSASLAFNPGGPFLMLAALFTLVVIVRAGILRRPPISSRPIFRPAVQLVAAFTAVLGGARLLF